MRAYRRKKARETAKNILILILIVMAIVLLSFFWGDVSLERLNPLTSDENTDSYVPEITALIKPEDIIVSYGDGNYSLITASETYEDESFCEKMDKIISVCMEYAESCSEITKEEYDEVKECRSVEMKFNYAQDFREYEKLKEINDGLDNKKIEQFDALAVGGESENCLYIKDSANGLFCKINIKENATGITEKRIDSLIECALEKDGPVYTTIGNLTGTESKVYIPEEKEVDKFKLGEKQGQLEFSIGEQKNINNIASGFFTSGLDFVRKITENKGAVMYTYGSNQMLIIEENGALSYSESLNATDAANYDMYHTLETAVEYVNDHGGWEELSEKGAEPYLKNVEKVSQADENGYKYYFGILVDDVPIEYTKGNIIEITVYGEQVVLYKRNILLLDSEDDETDKSGQSASVSGDGETSGNEGADSKGGESEDASGAGGESLSEDDKSEDAGGESEDISGAGGESDIASEEYTPQMLLEEKWKEIGSTLGYSKYKDFLKGIESFKMCYVRDTARSSLMIKPAWMVTMKDGSVFLYEKSTGERI